MAEEVVISFLGDVEDSLVEKVRSVDGFLSTSNRLIGGEQLVEIMFLIAAPTTVKLIRDVIVEIVKSKKKSTVTIGETKYENIRSDQVDAILEKSGLGKETDL